VRGAEFDWQENRESIVLGEQLALAIFLNDDGEIVLRQEDRWGDEDDVILIRPENARLSAQRP